MADLHEGRGPKLPKSAQVMIAVAVLLVCGSFFVQGLQGPKWLEHGLTIGALVALGVSWWLGARAKR